MLSINSRKNGLISLAFLLFITIVLIACAGSNPNQGGQSGSPENPIYATDAVESISPYPIEKDRLDEPIEKVIPGDGNTFGVPVIIDSVVIVTMDESLTGYGMRLTGTMPTPCHQLLYEFTEGDEDGVVQVEVFAIAKPGENCIQIIEQFDVTVPLDEYNPLKNTLWVNGIEAVEAE